MFPGLTSSLLSRVERLRHQAGVRVPVSPQPPRGGGVDFPLDWQCPRSGRRFAGQSLTRIYYTLTGAPAILTLVISNLKLEYFNNSVCLTSTESLLI